MAFNKNEFGQLIKSYRKQRGWTQEELADRWGHTREYVSRIERGKNKLDSVTQVVKLADILDIPQEKLEAIGRGIPQRNIDIRRPEQADDAILQMLLAPGRDMVQLSYMLWIADQAPILEEKLQELTFNLDKALTAYHGEFLRPAQQLLAYTHQMQGRIAFDRLDFASASGHFSEMIDLGEELNDADIITMGMIYQGSLLRKRGRFETSLRCFERAQSYADMASDVTRGIYHLNMSTLHADANHKSPFLRSIESAFAVATQMQPSVESLANEFSLDDVQWAHASGLSALWEAEEAVKIFKEIDKENSFKTLRALGGYTISKGKAYLRLGDLDQGVRLHLDGIQMASEYQSKRHIGWVEDMYTRLLVLPIGKDKRLNDLRDALHDVKKKQEAW